MYIFSYDQLKSIKMDPFMSNESPLKSPSFTTKEREKF